MKKFLAILILVFALQTPSQADDIRDFQIEGMSLGDSLLDYVNEGEIRIGPFYPKSKKFIMVKTNLSSEIYDDLQYHTKRNDKKYITYSVEGIISYKNNIKDCYRKMDEVVNDLTKIFDEVKPSKKRPIKSTYGKATEIRFEFNSGNLITATCNDYKKKYENFRDNLKIEIRSKEFHTWINTEAF